MRRLGGAAAAAAVLILLTGCGSEATTPTATPTVTVVETPSASSSASATPSSGATATASASASSAPASSSSASSGDPGRPADQCADDAIGVSVNVADGGGGAGNEEYNVIFTNTGGDSCVLRGTPGVSVVGDGNGTQLGQPASRNQSNATDVRLTPGESAAAPLRIVNIRNGGGPLGSACQVKKGDGFRVYPPHSTKAFFSESDDAYACTSSRVFMTVSAVIRFTD